MAGKGQISVKGLENANISENTVGENIIEINNVIMKKNGGKVVDNQ
jgi:hypothetical protein